MPGDDLHEIPKFRDRLTYLYVEHAVIERDLNSIAFFSDEGKTQVPIATLSVLMLGPGTKLTHSAVDVLARNNCLVAWCGEELVRMYAFGTGGTHSSSRMLRQAELIADPERRIAVVRQLYQMRFQEPLDQELTIQQLRGKEGNRVRDAYQRLAAQYDIEWTGRNYDRGSWNAADPANRALSAANACLYGICHAAILSMGYSPALGFIHTGKMLSFVYDIADLYKISHSVPVAFREAADGFFELERRVRLSLRDTFRETRFLDTIVRDLGTIFGPDPEGEDMEVYDDDPALPADLWEGE